VVLRRRATPHDLLTLIDLETRPLQVLNHPRGELLTGIVRYVLFEQPAQEVAATGDREADREGELVAEGSVIHGGYVLSLNLEVSDSNGDERRTAQEAWQT
jgi:hypothetical protein